MRVYFLDKTVNSEKVDSDNTTNPVWNQTLLIKEIIICGGYDAIKNDPPLVMLEVIDSSNLNQEVILGRCQVTPTIPTQHHEPYNKYQWYPLEYSNESYQQRYSFI